MTVILPFHDENPRLRRRPMREGTGQAYYGYALKRVLEAKPPRSIWECERMRRILIGLWIVVVIASIAFAVVINL